MSIKNTRKLTPILLVGLTASLLLTGCAATENESDPSPSPSVEVTPTAPSEGSSGEISDDEISSDVKPSSTPPAGTESIFGEMPAGEWSYVEAENAVVAATNSYEPSELEAYATRMIESGWTYTVTPELENETYVSVLTSIDEKKSITIVGAAKGAPDAEGNLTLPVSSIVYSK